MNNKGADQFAHVRSLISIFVFRFWESIVSKLATGEISIFLLVPVAEETGLKLTLSETPKTGFLATRPIWSLLPENLILLHVNNKGTDQPAHSRSLISAFVIHFLKSIIAKHETCKISRF